MAFSKKSSHYKQLKNKLLARHASLQKNLWDRHGESLDWLSAFSKEFAIGSLSGLMLLSSPVAGLLPAPSIPSVKHDQFVKLDSNMFFRADLGTVLPSEVRPLTLDEEKSITEILSRETGYKVSGELQGIRLAQNYGYIGQEQHLARYPGDSMSTHFESAKEAEVYADKGMAPGLGAWGYFAASRNTMTVKDALREKYYIAAQTFLAPGFAEHTGEYISFFKFRKMLVVNTENGRAMAVVIGDAGPAANTGKHLGGSPEVMKYLERVDGRQKGPVLYFFLDDPGDKIPLGPFKLVEKSNVVSEN